MWYYTLDSRILPLLFSSQTYEPAPGGNEMSDISGTIMDIFAAVERRDAEAFVHLCHPQVTFQWPPSLPYGRPEARPTWEETWDPLQPTSEERAMDPEVMGSRGTKVVVRWHQRAIDLAGRRLDEEVLGLYQVQDGRLATSQMFYFDTARVSRFLAGAGHGPSHRRC
jgi:ketosteroid isomerase-like protein